MYDVVSGSELQMTGNHPQNVVSGTTRNRRGHWRTEEEPGETEQHGSLGDGPFPVLHRLTSLP